MLQVTQNADQAPSSADMLCAGRVIGGKYRLDWPLGEGGMGVVWRATHIGLDSPVAIKLLGSRQLASPRDVDAFLHEAIAAAAVRHRNVASTTDFGTDADGQPFMVMELLEGMSLASRFEAAEPMPMAELVDVIAQCLSGLAAVHDAGILHRDLKPENVFIVVDGEGSYPKLIDFGISRSLRDTPGSVARSGQKRRGAMPTNADVMMGTPHYMSPEQAGGERDIDQRADLYAMGVILYEGLAGHAPYDRPSVAELLCAIVRGGALPLEGVRPEVGPALSEVVAKAMALREERYSNAREMRAALLAAVSPIARADDVWSFAEPMAQATPDARSAPAKRGRSAGMTAAVLALVLALGFASWAALTTDTFASHAPAGGMQAQAARGSERAAPTLVVATKTPRAVSTTVALDTVRDRAALGSSDSATSRARPRSPAPTARSSSTVARINGVFRDPGF